MGIWIMSLYGRLKKEKDRLGKIVLRSPKTKQELLDRGRWERVTKILTRRYEYGIDTFLDDLRREDHLDELRDIERMRTERDPATIAMACVITLWIMGAMS